jgi:putative DNA primase/helicase
MQHTHPESNGTTHCSPLDDLARSKRLDPAWLRSLGVTDGPDGAVSISYTEEDGRTLFRRQRNPPGREPRFIQPKGARLVPYGVWRLDRARESGIIFLAEGESDTWALWTLDLPALGIPGAQAWSALQPDHLIDIQTAYIVPDNDEAGESFVSGAIRRLKKIGWTGKAYRLRLPAGIKDVSDLSCADVKGFTAAMDKLIAGAEPLTDKERKEESRPPSPVVSERLATVCLNAVRAKPIKWLIPDQVPLGKLTLAAGDGGLGKSTITLSWAACITTGRPCSGLDYPPLPPSDVLLISCEDDEADTIVPRLLAAGADLRRCHSVRGVEGAEPGKTTPFSLADVEALAAELRARPEVRLVVIDPVTAFVGRAGTDDHKDSEVRALLAPLSELAALANCAIVLVIHLNKQQQARAVSRVLGSVAYVNAVRSVLLTAPDPQDPERRLLLPAKQNLTCNHCGVAYRTVPLTPEEQARALAGRVEHLAEEDRQRLAAQLYRVEWLGRVETSADEAMKASRRNDPNKVQRCAEWLTEVLSVYAYPSSEIEEMAEKQDFTRDNVYRARAILKKSAGRV